MRYLEVLQLPLPPLNFSHDKLGAFLVMFQSDHLK